MADLVSAAHNLGFIDADPVTAAYNANVKAIQDARTRDLNAEKERQTIDITGAQAPSRLRSLVAGADTAETEAAAAKAKLPYAGPTAATNLRQLTANAGLTETRAQEEKDKAPYAGPRAAAEVRQTQAGAVNTELAPFYKSLDLLNQGRVDEARETARQAGHSEIPQFLIDDADMRSALTQAAHRAKEVYPDRPADQQTFIHAYMTAAQERRTAGQRANTPTSTYDVPGAPTPQEETRDTHNFDVINRNETDANGRAVVKSYKFDKRTGEMTPVEGEGAFNRTGAGAGGGGNSVYQQKRRDWIAVHPGDQQGALDYASGRRQLSGAELVRSARQQAIAEINGNTMLHFKTEQERNNAINRVADENLRRMTQANAPAAPAAPAAAPAPAPAPAPARAPQSVAPAVRSPPPEAIAYLRANPQFAPDFDQKYGQGAAARALGQ